MQALKFFSQPNNSKQEILNYFRNRRQILNMTIVMEEFELRKFKVNINVGQEIQIK